MNLFLMIKQYLTDEEWKNILYSFGDDKEIHYITVRKMCDELINSVNEFYSFRR
jgi:hypothetical protein